MSDFKVGDKVRIKKGSGYYQEERPCNPRGVVGVVISDTTTPFRYRVDWGNGQLNSYSDGDLELVETNVEIDMEKKYKLKTELSLQDILQLRVFTGQLTNMTKLYKELLGICEEDLDIDTARGIWRRYTGGPPRAWQELCKEAVRKSKRKVVTIGDKKYYEDELQTALSNIKPINQ